MNLSNPSFDAVIKMDKRLDELQNEVKQLEKEYGFSEKHVQFYRETKGKQPPPPQQTKKGTTTTTTKPSTKTHQPKNATLKDKRFGDLPSIEAEPLPQVKPKPEIDLAWQNANKVKPSLEPFFEKETFMPTYIDQKDFQCKPVFCSDYGYFYNYMSSFGLNHNKQHKV